MLTYAPWRAVRGLAHGFLGRGECAGAADWHAAVARAGVPLPGVTARQVHDAFRARVGDGTAPAWSHRGGRLHLDLRAAARLLLRGAGVGRVAVLGPCTACGPGYCSYRRDGARAGRQLSFVGWASPPVA